MYTCVIINFDHNPHKKLLSKTFIRKFHQKLSPKAFTRNFHQKLSPETFTRNFHQKLLPVSFHLPFDPTANIALFPHSHSSTPREHVVQHLVQQLQHRPLSGRAIVVESIARYDFSRFALNQPPINPPTNIVSQVSGPVVRATSPGVYVIIGVSLATK